MKNTISNQSESNYWLTVNLDKRGKQSILIHHEVRIKKKTKRVFKVPNMPLSELEIINEENEDESSRTSQTLNISEIWL